LNLVLNVENLSIKIIENDYISLTDIAKYKNEENPDDIIKGWIKSSKTIDFLSDWEDIANPKFNSKLITKIKRI